MNNLRENFIMNLSIMLCNVLLFVILKLYVYSAVFAVMEKHRITILKVQK